jgi:phenylalanyl-tRNA synthetase beta chain
MSAKLGLRTEASTRNEKNLAPALTDLAAARAVRLLDGPGVTVGPAQVYGAPLAPPHEIVLRGYDVERLLGFNVADDELAAALTSLGFTLTPLPAGGGSGFTVTVPSWRTDVHAAPDLVEEVARIVGYDRVRGEVPATAPHAVDSIAFDQEMSIAQTLAGLGYAECLTLGLQPRSVAERWREAGLDVPAVVEIANPLSEDQRWMRFSLLPALLDHARRERATRPLRTFEIGHIFADAPAAPLETNVVTLLATTKPYADAPAWRDDAFLAASSDARALVRAVTGIDARLERGAALGLHPGKCARIIADGRAVGFVGSVDPRVLRAAEIADDAVAAVVYIDDLPARRVRYYVPVSKFPAVERDLAIVVDVAVAAADVIDTIRSAVSIARRIDLFDEYRGPQIGAGKKSLGVRIGLQRDDATLTDSEADAAMQAIVGALRDTHGAVLRG